MSRLIDADLLMRKCEKWLKPKAPDEDEMVSVADIAVSTLMEIEEQPTAFDVEEVVRELTELKMRYYMTIANTGDADKDCAYLNTANTIDKAIEIVKRGGVDENKEQTNACYGCFGAANGDCDECAKDWSDKQ